MKKRYLFSAGMQLTVQSQGVWLVLTPFLRKFPAPKFELGNLSSLGVVRNQQIPTEMACSLVVNDFFFGIFPNYEHSG